MDPAHASSHRKNKEETAFCASMLAMPMLHWSVLSDHCKNTGFGPLTHYTPSFIFYGGGSPSKAIDTLYDPYLHFCYELALETSATYSSIKSLRVHDLCYAHSLASPHCLLVQNLSSEQIAPTDAIRPQFHDEYTRHQWLKGFNKRANGLLNSYLTRLTRSHPVGLCQVKAYYTDFGCCKSLHGC